MCSQFSRSLSMLFFICQKSSLSTNYHQSSFLLSYNASQILAVFTPWCIIGCQRSCSCMSIGCDESAWNVKPMKDYIKRIVIVIGCYNTVMLITTQLSPAWLSHFSLGWLFTSFLHSRPHPHLLQRLLLFTLKPFVLNLRYMGQRKYRPGEINWWPFHDPVPGHGCGTDCLSAWYSENHSSDHYKTWYLYPCCHAYYLVRFWRNYVGNFFGNFYL